MFRLVKKTLFIVFIISAVVFCIGCSQNDGSDKNDDKNLFFCQNF